MTYKSSWIFRCNTEKTSWEWTDLVFFLSISFICFWLLIVPWGSHYAVYTWTFPFLAIPTYPLFFRPYLTHWYWLQSLPVRCKYFGQLLSLYYILGTYMARIVYIYINKQFYSHPRKTCFSFYLENYFLLYFFLILLSEYQFPSKVCPVFKERNG